MTKTSFKRPSAIAKWVEAMRFRTLPAGSAGVIAGTAWAIVEGSCRPVTAILCLAFALLAQIASNFANEYFDWRNGTDAPGREGFRRGVTEGDISPRAMLRAACLTLGAACVIGLIAVRFNPWMIAVGAAVALAVFAYSAGPFPLSRKPLGEIAVIVFYGIVAVNLTFYLQAGRFTLLCFLASLGIGLLAANIMLVNNTRDIDSDRAAGRRTLAVIFGKKAMTRMYAAFGWIGIVLTCPLMLSSGNAQISAAGAAFVGGAVVAVNLLAGRLRQGHGRELNAVLSHTGQFLFVVAAALLVFALIR